MAGQLGADTYLLLGFQKKQKQLPLLYWALQLGQHAHSQAVDAHTSSMPHVRLAAVDR